MLITYLGHAGFCVETSRVTVVMDPWLSSTGAFDCSWFQLPRNHYLASPVEQKLADSGKERFLYISHEHKDHFDIDYLRSLACRDFTIVVPRFRRDALRTMLADYGCRGVISCADEEVVPIPEGFLKLYVDDSELNRDSAILIEADGQKFLNINDCKLYDRIPSIGHQHGQPAVFASQFSGATWHPTCYEFPREKYETVSRKKLSSKFEAVARCIDTLQPGAYIPSAGPPCFLDPRLMHLNFEPVNVFPRAPRLLKFLHGRLRHTGTMLTEMMPGDVLDSATGELTFCARDRLCEDGFVNYISAYAEEFAPLFQSRMEMTRHIDAEEVFLRLQRELERKLEPLRLLNEVPTPLYFFLEEVTGKALRVDFTERKVGISDSVLPPTGFYSITAPAWQLVPVLDGRMTWEDFALTFRVRLKRQPDMYHTMLNGFLFMEAQDIAEFCESLARMKEPQDRTPVSAGGYTYLVDRYCPHQHGDLTEGWVEQDRYLVCPRHGWKFDLANHGRCTSNATTINAVCTAPASSSNANNLALQTSCVAAHELSHLD